MGANLYPEANSGWLFLFKHLSTSDNVASQILGLPGQAYTSTGQVVGVGAEHSLDIWLQVYTEKLEEKFQFAQETLTPGPDLPTPPQVL